MSEEHFARRTQKKPHGTQAERKTAKRLGARVIPGSGAMASAKGDLVLPTWLVENKATINASISVKLEWLHKISQEATEIGKKPAVTIQFVDKMGNSDPRDRWVMVREVDYQELTE